MATAVIRNDVSPYRSNLITSEPLSSNDYIERTEPSSSSSVSVRTVFGSGSLSSKTNTFQDSVDSNIQAFLNDLALLMSDTEEDEDEYPIPTSVAHIAIYFVIESFDYFTSRWVRPRLATDGAGGIRMTWVCGASEIRAVLPASKSRTRYLYIEDQSGHRTVNNFNAVTLAVELQRIYAISHVK